MENMNFDELAKSRFYPVFVIPAEAGIQLNQSVLGSRLRGSDGFFDFLRFHQFSLLGCPPGGLSP
jgi:hypothetical protein